MKNGRGLELLGSLYLLAVGYYFGKTGADKVLAAKLKGEYERLVKATSVMWHQAVYKEFGGTDAS